MKNLVKMYLSGCGCGVFNACSVGVWWGLGGRGGGGGGGGGEGEG